MTTRVHTGHARSCSDAASLSHLFIGAWSILHRHPIFLNKRGPRFLLVPVVVFVVVLSQALLFCSRDCWRNRLSNQAYLTESSWWVSGSVYRSSAGSNVEDKSKDGGLGQMFYNLHINGNALYNTVAGFREYLSSVRAKIPTEPLGVDAILNLDIAYEIVLGEIGILSLELLVREHGSHLGQFCMIILVSLALRLVVQRWHKLHGLCHAPPKVELGQVFVPSNRRLLPSKVIPIVYGRKHHDTISSEPYLRLPTVLWSSSVVPS